MSNSLLASAVLTADPAIVWRDVAGEVVLLNPKSDRIMGLNGCGGETWKLLDGERSLTTIAHAISERFRGDSEQVLSDVIAFATILVQRGLATSR